MKRLLSFIFFVAAMTATAQVNQQPIIVQNYIPTGSCVLSSTSTIIMVTQNVSGTGAGLYQCIAGNWAYYNPFATGSGGLSGMTTGQIPVAATATTVTSSIPKVGNGTGGLIAAPTTQGVSGDVMVFDPAGGAYDSGHPPVANGTAAGQPILWNGSSYLATTISQDASISGSGILTNKGMNGVLMSGLGSGLVRNTTATGVPSIETASQLSADVITALLTLSGCMTPGYVVSPQGSNCVAPGVTASGSPASTYLAIFSSATGITGSSAIAVTGTPAAPTGLSITIPGGGITALNVNGTTFDGYGTPSFAGPCFKIAGVTTNGTYGCAAVLASPNSLATSRTTAHGTSGSPITIVSTQQYSSSNLQDFYINCEMNVKTAAASTSVSLYITWTDDQGTETAGPYSLSTATKPGYLSTGSLLVSAVGNNGTTTNVGYYTTLSGTGQAYGDNCTALGIQK